MGESQMTISKLAAALISAGTIVAFASGAQAGERVFHFERADLSYDRGVEVTLERVDFAARRACDTGTVGLWVRRIEDQCIDNTKAEMIEKIGDSRLTLAARGSDRVARN